MSVTKREQENAGVAGSQTLMRGLDVIEAAAHGATTLHKLADTVGLTRSTAHRLAASLIERGYLSFTPRGTGYRLGPKLLELGNLAHRQVDIIQVARPHLEALSEKTEDTVHLGVLDKDSALYLDKMPGQRRITISSFVGDRQPLSSTGLGKALMLDHDPAYWGERFHADQKAGAPPAEWSVWLSRMTAYAQEGRAFDLEENEDKIRCVAAPVRGSDGSIVGAISVSSAAQYMSDERMADLTAVVTDSARAISLDLGWAEKKGT